MAEPRGWEVVFHCPACDQQARIWLAVPVYYLMTGPSLTCAHCGAIVAVTLTVAFTGEAAAKVPPGQVEGPHHG